jgi:hypothetical protein
MDVLRLTITGSSDEIDLLEQFGRQYGLSFERGVVSSYEGMAITLIALHFTAPVEILAQFLAAYHAARQAPLRGTYFLPGKGEVFVRDFTLTGIAAVLRLTAQLHLETNWP